MRRTIGAIVAAAAPAVWTAVGNCVAAAGVPGSVVAAVWSAVGNCVAAACVPGKGATVCGEIVEATGVWTAVGGCVEAAGVPGTVVAAVWAGVGSCVAFETGGTEVDVGGMVDAFSDADTGGIVALKMGGMVSGAAVVVTFGAAVATGAIVVAAFDGVSVSGTGATGFAVVGLLVADVLEESWTDSSPFNAATKGGTTVSTNSW